LPIYNKSTKCNDDEKLLRAVSLSSARELGASSATQNELSESSYLDIKKMSARLNGIFHSSSGRYCLFLYDLLARLVFEILEKIISDWMRS